MVLGFRVAGALACAHRVGIVHRDVKPSNIILVGGDIARAKLVDFGIARVLDRTQLTSTGATLGTVGYMAPEQARAEAEIDARADVYALGAVLFRCLSGRAPFEGTEALAVLMAQAQSEAPRLSELLEDVPPQVDELLARALRRARAERPADGAGLLDELRRLGTFPPGAPPLPLRTAVSRAGAREMQSAVEARSARPAPTTTTAAPVAAGPKARIPIAALVALALGVLASGAILVVGVRHLFGLDAFDANGAPAACWTIRCASINYTDPAHVDALEVLPTAIRLAQSVDPSATLCGVDVGGPGDGTANIGAQGRSPTGLSSVTYRFNAKSNKGIMISAMPGQLVAVETTPSPHTVSAPTCPVRSVAHASGLGGKGYLLMAYHYDETTGAPMWNVSTTTALVHVDGRTCKKR
jgi:hypothetical protein